MGRLFVFLALLLAPSAPLTGQGTGAGSAVPSVEDALARMLPFDASAGGPTLLRRGGTGLEPWTTPWTGIPFPEALGGQANASLTIPELRLLHNSALPHAPNEGSLWASRGPSARILIGGVLETHRFELALAPEVTWSRNRAFQIVQPTNPLRHPFASPWHGPPYDSADLPLRPGAEPLLWIHPGQSSLSFRWRGLRTGLGTENRWWGPGLGNALVLGGDAPGFPHVFLETTRPHSTPLGELEAVWLLGRLVASPWFAGAEEPRPRAITGLSFTLEPVRGFRFGGARLVVRPDAGPLGVVLDPLLNWEPARRPDEDGSDVYEPETDQVFSIFFQVAPTERAEVYGEWARMDPPGSMRELLETPQHSQGYTVGFQWRSAGPSSGRSVRVHVEATNLEQTRIRTDRPMPPPFYTGRATTEGLTHRGRVLGAAIGPGSQSQHLSLDLLGPGALPLPGWRVGLLLGRIRWENDTLSRLASRTPFSHDVSLLSGIRAAGEMMGLRAEGQLVYQKRFNYLFQNGINRPAELRTVDVTNWTMGLTIRPAGTWPW